MDERGVADLLGCHGVAFCELMLAERDREVSCGGEPGPDGRGREGVDSTTLLPQVERRSGQLGAGLAICRHEIGAGPYKFAIERADELDVTVALVVLPERPYRKTGLIFLYRELETAVGRRPRVPRGAERAVGVVLVEEITLARDELAAQEEEATRHLSISGQVQGIRHEGAVARPEIGVRVPVEAEHVRVVRRDDRAAVVDLRPDHEGRALVEAVDLVREMLGDGFVLVGPEPPVILRAREERCGRPLAHELV